jgi:hypothetical protein
MSSSGAKKLYSCVGRGKHVLPALRDLYESAAGRVWYGVRLDP